MPTAHGFRVVDAFSRIVRLGEGVGATGLLSEVAMERTLASLVICASKIDRRGATRIRCVATEACRKARNGADFLGRVRAETGLELEIISGEEEARLSMLGCEPLLDYSNDNALIFDIGGGSTEFMWLELVPHRDPVILGWASFPFGLITIAEDYGSDPAPETYRAMVTEVSARIAPFAMEKRLAECVAAGRVQMIGTSGTVTTLAGVHLGLQTYDRSRVDGMWIGFADLERVAARLMDMDCGTRAGVGCIGQERADLVIPGCAILEAVSRTWPVGRMRIADRGLREGMLVTMMRRDANVPQPSAAD